MAGKKTLSILAFKGGNKTVGKKTLRALAVKGIKWLVKKTLRTLAVTGRNEMVGKKLVVVFVVMMIMGITVILMMVY